MTPTSATMNLGVAMKSNICKDMYSVWEKAKAIEINGEIFSNFYVDYPEDKTDDMLTASRVSEDFLIFEEYITVEMVERGKVIDNIYTLEVKTKDGKAYITPLFYAGEKRGYYDSKIRV